MAKTKVHPFSRDQIRLRFIEATKWILDNNEDINGMTGLAEVVGANRAGLTRMMSNEDNYPQIQWIGAYDHFFHVSSEWLITGNGDMKKTISLEARVKKLEQTVARLIN